MVAEGFAGFVTVDQNIAFQQNVAASDVAVFVLVAATNRRKELRPLMPALLDALDKAKPGSAAYHRPSRLHSTDQRAAAPNGARLP